MGKTVVGLFDDYAAAQNVVRELIDSGFSRENIQITAKDELGEAAGGSSQTGKATSGLGATISNAVSSLFGTGASREETGYYSEAVRRGGALVTVNADDNTVDHTVGIMERYGAVNIDERVAQWRQQGWSDYDPDAETYNAGDLASESRYYQDASAVADAGGVPAGGDYTRADAVNQNEIAVPIVEEQLQIDKRAVQRGGVRIHSSIIEQPVEETVRLREEHVNVERRSVDRAVSDADLAAFKEGTIEITETAEEAVVAKRARVVEEVVVNKNIEERMETVRDTVRRTNVEVEQLAPPQDQRRATAATTTTTTGSDTSNIYYPEDRERGRS